MKKKKIEITLDSVLMWKNVGGSGGDFDEQTKVEFEFKKKTNA